jgi:ATPase subunit of ABC transporter with duplicated ATPase domains
MIDISVNNLVKSFTIGDNLLDGLSFQVNEGERVGILGKNGCGKSTLFKILTREYDYDEGELTLAPGKRMGLISQIPVYPVGCTVDQVLDDAFVRIHRMEREMEQLAAAMAAGDSSTETLNRYDYLSNEFQRAGGYDTQVQINKVCNGLGISPEMRGQAFEMLSGGEKTRVNLGRLILEDTDILLLDEPTNHLDVKHQIELIDYLKAWTADGRHSVVGVFHDVNLALRLTDNMLFMKDGRLLRGGKFSEVASRDFLTGLFDMDIAGYMVESLEKWKRVQ